MPPIPQDEQKSRLRVMLRRSWATTVVLALGCMTLALNMSRARTEAMGEQRLLESRVNELEVRVHVRENEWLHQLMNQ